MKKLTKKQFFELVKMGPVQIDEQTFYVLVKMNEEQVEMSELLKKQLIEEGKYDETYVGILTSENKQPYSQDYLPIFGDSKKYVTKFLVRSPEDAVNFDLGKRSLGVIKRHFEFTSQHS